MGEQRNITILIATGLYPPDIGGPATHARFIESALPEHGFTIKVVPFGPVRKYPKVVRHAVLAWRLWRQAKTADIIYALDPISVGLPALIVSKLRRRPFVLRLGGDYAWEQGRQRFSLSETLDEYTAKPQAAPLSVRLLAWLQRFVARQAQCVILPSNYLAEIVKTWGVSADRMQVVYSVLYPLPVTDDKNSARAKLGLTGAVIVTAGRLVPWKGVSALIRVFGKLRIAHPDSRLVIIGDGTERKNLEVQVTVAGLSNEVQFLGAVDKATLGLYKRAADVFVLNTAYEGLSHELLEVMDLETPIVTTDCGGNPELITDNVSGRLVGFNEEPALLAAIVETLENAPITNSLVAAAKNRTGNFKLDVLSKQLASLFKTINNH